MNGGGYLLNNGASRLVMWLLAIANLLLMDGSKGNNLTGTLTRFKRKRVTVCQSGC